MSPMNSLRRIEWPAGRHYVRIVCLSLMCVCLYACGTEEEYGPIEDVDPALVESPAAAVRQAIAAPAGFVHVPSGAFVMGNTGAFGDAVNEGPQRTVGISQFFMAINEVTQSEYMQHMQQNPSAFKGPDRPVESVTWYEAVQYCNNRSLAEGLTAAYDINGKSVNLVEKANGFRLPTEAEWEYACRAGSPSDLSNGDLTVPPYDCTTVDPMLDKIAWYCANSGDSTHVVGQKNANGFGLKGMHGNVAEWCWDYFAVYRGEDAENPRGPASGKNRVVRGGAYKFPAAECRSSRRIPMQADMLGFRRATIGFRLVRAVH